MASKNYKNLKFNYLPEKLDYLKNDLNFSYYLLRFILSFFRTFNDKHPLENFPKVLDWLLTRLFSISLIWNKIFSSHNKHFFHFSRLANFSIDKVVAFSLFFYLNKTWLIKVLFFNQNFKKKDFAFVVNGHIFLKENFQESQQNSAN